MTVPGGLEYIYTDKRSHFPKCVDSESIIIGLRHVEEPETAFSLNDYGIKHVAHMPFKSHLDHSIYTMALNVEKHADKTVMVDIFDFANQWNRACDEYTKATRKAIDVNHSNLNTVNMRQLKTLINRRMLGASEPSYALFAAQLIPVENLIYMIRLMGIPSNITETHEHVFSVGFDMNCHDVRIPKNNPNVSIVGSSSNHTGKSLYLVIGPPEQYEKYDNMLAWTHCGSRVEIVITSELKEKVIRNFRNKNYGTAPNGNYKAIVMKIGIFLNNTKFMCDKDPEWTVYDLEWLEKETKLLEIFTVPTNEVQPVKRKHNSNYIGLGFKRKREDYTEVRAL